MRGPVPSPSDTPPLFVLTPAATGVEPGLLTGAGVVLVGVGIATGDAGWSPVVVAPAAYALGYVLSVATGGGARRRTLGRVGRFLPAEIVHEHPSLPSGLGRAAGFLLIAAIWSVGISAVVGGAFALVMGGTMLHDLAVVRAWEREHGARLAYEHWGWSYRLSHPFNLPEHVGVRPAATAAPRHEDAGLGAEVASRP